MQPGGFGVPDADGPMSPRMQSLDQRFPPIRPMPAGLPTGAGGGNTRLVVFINKHSSQDARNLRVIMLVPPFLFQSRQDGTITRVLTLDRIGDIMYDRELNRVLIKAVAPPVNDRDWLFEWILDDRRNSHGPDAFLECVNAFRDRVMPPGSPPLVYRPSITGGKPQLSLIAGMLNPKEQLKMYQDDPSKIPAVRPEDDPPRDGALDTYRLILNNSESPLGVRYVVRNSPEGSRYPTELWAGVIECGGAASVAGVRPQKIVSVNGVNVYTGEQFKKVIQDAKSRHPWARREPLELVLVQERLEGFYPPPDELEGHTIELATPESRLGIQYAQLEDEGLFIEEVAIGTPSFDAGLPPRAKIHSCDGVLITDEESLKYALDGVRMQNRTEFTIETAQKAPSEEFDRVHDYDDGYYEEAEESEEELDETTSVGTVDAVPIKGAKKALIIGVDYRRARSKAVHLPGSTVTAKRLAFRLKERGFGQIKTLLDSTSSDVPTRKNIMEACAWLTEGAYSGDSLFLGFVGHGVDFPGVSRPPAPGTGWGLAPADFRRSGTIREQELRSALID
eukprot:Hpha_TRINITY_DN18849_c0_g1::TRINITY_DN18849_c0_g1_i1::g.26161::m.26161